MTDFALQALNLTKVFKVWKKPSDMLLETVTGRTRHTDFHALDDVSFDLAHGSVLGVLGRNGAGKSTLLRLVAGTLDPSRGSVTSSGRIASILELGTGFHPDYSGRENVFLGGMCLGLSRNEIKRRFDEIVDFSELAEFIDRPFRTYSSGMQARLTFAVATSISPDILIIDEALAVGDARFNLKSFDRIREFRRQGRAILLVSHDINTVSSFCDQAILLERGKLIASGNPATVANIYHELLFGEGSKQPDQVHRVVPLITLAEIAEAESEATLRVEQAEPPAAGVPDIASPAEDEIADLGSAVEQNNGSRSEQYRRYGDRAVEIVQFRILDAQGGKVVRLKSLSAFRFHVKLRAQSDVVDAVVGILIRNTRGMQIFAANSFEPVPTLVVNLTRGEEVDILMPFEANMGHGTYFASAIAARSDGLKHDAQFDALEFSIEQTNCHDDSVANLNMSFELQPNLSDDNSRLGATRQSVPV